ncbi:MAG: hypothetical protein KBA82_06805 [Nitrosomonas sp.]|jgi:hypothetical protein|nr:hypothetical protein [Nitrosomonas sp.]MBP7112678.1 hypothetical protein [Nitrosomonas sp.]MBP9871201.1 hypothetical protein [Nitrosomonas sp.]
MTIESNTHTENMTDSSRQQTLQISVKMQQNQHTSHPIYSNFTTVQGGHRIVMVDFGFIDPQLINTLNRVAKSGEKTPDTIDATMSCRLALSVETALQLTQQLNQLFQSKSIPKTQTEQHDTENHPNTSISVNTPEEKNITVENQRGFKFPWSS